jgi:hypothetical protein
VVGGGRGRRGLIRGCPRWCDSVGRSRRRGRGLVVTGGVGVVGDGLRIGAELVGAAVGPSVAGGNGARGGTLDGSGGGDLAVEARAGCRWRRLKVWEAAWCCLIAWGGTLGGGQRLEVQYSAEKWCNGSWSKTEQSSWQAASRGTQ